MRHQTAEAIVTSRLLVLQSKRMVLNSLERRYNETRAQTVAARIAAQRAEVELAHARYRSSMLSWGSPRQHGYWVVAYGRLIEVGRALSTKLRDAAVDLPAEERYQASADVEMLESLIGSWTQSMRESMAEATA